MRQSWSQKGILLKATTSVILHESSQELDRFFTARIEQLQLTGSSHFYESIVEDIRQQTVLLKERHDCPYVCLVYSQKLMHSCLALRKYGYVKAYEEWQAHEREHKGFSYLIVRPEHRWKEIASTVITLVKKREQTSLKVSTSFVIEIGYQRFLWLFLRPQFNLLKKDIEIQERNNTLILTVKKLNCHYLLSLQEELNSLQIGVKDFKPTNSEALVLSNLQIQKISQLIYHQFGLPNLVKELRRKNNKYVVITSNQSHGNNTINTTLVLDPKTINNINNTVTNTNIIANTNINTTLNQNANNTSMISVDTNLHNDSINANVNNIDVSANINNIRNSKDNATQNNSGGNSNIVTRIIKLQQRQDILQVNNQALEFVCKLGSFHEIACYKGMKFTATRLSNNLQLILSFRAAYLPRYFYWYRQNDGNDSPIFLLRKYEQEKLYLKIKYSCSLFDQAELMFSMLSIMRQLHKRNIFVGHHFAEHFFVSNKRVVVEPGNWGSINEDLELSKNIFYNWIKSVSQIEFKQRFANVSQLTDISKILLEYIQENK